MLLDYEYIITILDFYYTVKIHYTTTTPARVEEGGDPEEFSVGIRLEPSGDLGLDVCAGISGKSNVIPLPWPWRLCGNTRGIECASLRQMGDQAWVQNEVCPMVLCGRVLAEVGVIRLPRPWRRPRRRLPRRRDTDGRDEGIPCEGLWEGRGDTEGIPSEEPVGSAVRA